jgi:hypothetical protein
VGLRGNRRPKKSAQSGTSKFVLCATNNEHYQIMKWAMHPEKRNAHKVLIWKPEDTIWKA